MCQDYIGIIGEVVFSNYKNLNKGDNIKIVSFVNHDDEIKEFDRTINPKDDRGNWRSITIRKWREEWVLINVLGFLAGI